MKTLSELKKLKAGQTLKLIYTKYKWKNNVPLPISRKIKHIQSNALTLEPLTEYGIVNPSWLYFPKKSEFEGTEKGFKILEESTHEALLEYEITEGE